MSTHTAQLVSGVVLIGALVATEAFADPVTITNGTIVAQASGGSFSLTGDGFQVTGRVPQGFSAPGVFQCDPCSGADRLPMDLNSFASFHVEAGATRFQSVSYPSTNLFGVFVLASPFNAFSSANVADRGSSPLVPFTLSGELLDYPADSNGTGTPLFYAQLSGSGVAHADFANVGGGEFAAEAITYQFSAPAGATPEPASLLLLASGLAGVAGFRRSDSRRARTESTAGCCS